MTYLKNAKLRLLPVLAIRNPTASADRSDRVGGPIRNQPGFFLLLLCSLAAYILLGYFTNRADFLQLISLYGFLFVIYAFLIRIIQDEKRLRIALGAAFLFRLSLLLVLPNLSDDYFRFVWDGRLLAHGLNPYLILPSEFIQTPAATEIGLHQELFQQLNSPHYYTVYPPVDQLIFAMGAWLFPHNLLGSVVIMRLFILLAEVGTMGLLMKFARKLQLSPAVGLLYALNPLVIVELTGNLHFEAIMIFFLLLAIVQLLPDQPGTTSRNRLPVSVVSLALSVGVKLIPLLFLPLLWKWLGLRRGLLYCLSVGVLVLLLFMPFVSTELIARFTSSVNLYFQKFEFNASVYYLVRELGYRVYGYNIIAGAGVALSFIVLLSVLKLAAFAEPANYRSFFIAALFSLTAYYALATTVHPWYITTLVILAVFTPYRFALVWSALIPVSYFTYRTTAYQENLWLVALEYGFAFGWMIYEIVREHRLRR